MTLPPDSSKDDATACSANGESGAKRRRIAIACSACRIRKSRCNGDRPRCDPCKRLGFECLYETPEASANLIIPKDLFAALEEKVKTLERTVSQHEDRLAAAEAGVARPGHDVTIPSSSATRLGQVVTPGTAISVSLQDSKEQQNGASTTDGMAIALVDDSDCGFFGPSSNISFMRHIFAAFSRKWGTQEESASLSRGSSSLYDHGIFNVAKPSTPMSINGHPESPTAEFAVNILPPDHEMEALLQAYFSNTGLLFPYIHEETFLETYNDLKRKSFSTSVRRTWLGLLNMILAMATNTASKDHDCPPSPTNDSDIFYRRAQRLCRSQMLRGTNLETVQYLLLTSQYLQGTQRSLQTWTTHGLAVKAAFSIGLHSNDILKRFGPLEREIRKRTWYGCVLLDRSLSMTFGRPCSIPEELIHVELPTHLGGNIREETSIAFYNATICLYQILWKIMARIYGYNLGHEKPETDTSIVTHILQLSFELNEWQSSLPRSLALRPASELAITDNSPEDVINERYRMVLSLRLLNTRLLLHRVVLTKSLDKSDSTGTGASIANPVGQMERNFNLECVRSAEDIISIVHSVLTRPCLGKHLIGAWWFTLYYTFNAALAIFGSLLAPLDDEADVSGCSLARLARARRSIEEAIGALIELDQGNSVIDRCINYLRYLVRLVDGWSSMSPSWTVDALSAFQLMQNRRTGTEFGSGPDQNSLNEVGDMGSLETGADIGELELGPFTTELQRWFEDPALHL